MEISLMENLRSGRQFYQPMKLFLVISVIFLPCALGQHVQCYSNVESKDITSPKSYLHCTSQCGKADIDLPDGSFVIVRSCGDFFADMPALLARSDLSALSQNARTALSRMSSRDLHLCNKDLCNAAHPIVSSLWLVIMTVITAVIGINSN